MLRQVPQQLLQQLSHRTLQQVLQHVLQELRHELDLTVYDKDTIRYKTQIKCLFVWSNGQLLSIVDKAITTCENPTAPDVEFETVTTT